MDKLPNGDVLNLGKIPKSKPKTHEFFQNIDAEIARQFEGQKQAGQKRMEARQALLQIPDPVVFKNASPVKALLL